MPKGIYIREQGKPRPWRRKLPEVFTCQQCSSLFPNKWGKFKKFCSNKCKALNQRGQPSKRKGTTVSKESRERMRKATEKLMASGWRPNTKGLEKYKEQLNGIASPNLRKLLQRIRGLKKMGEWRNAVLRIDSNACRRCGSIENLHAHHIYQLNAILIKEGITNVEEAENCKELWDISNGACVCEDCHKKTHREYEEVNHILLKLVKEGRVVQSVQSIKGRNLVLYQWKI